MDFKINDTGSITWEKCYGGSNDDGPTNIQQTSDSGYIIVGRTASNDGDITNNYGGAYDYWAVKINDTGMLIWQHTYGGSGDDEAAAVTETIDGGYIATGYSNSFDYEVTGNHGSNDFWTLKLNDTGGITWAKCYGGSQDDAGEAIQQTTDSGYIMIGLSSSSDYDVTANYGSYDIWVVKIDGNGIIQWQKNLGGDSLDAGYGITQTFDNGYAAIGYTRSFDHDVTYNYGSADFWVIKLGQNPSVIPIPGHNDISVYPNPTCDFLNINAAINPDNSKISVYLYDIIGKEIYSLQYVSNGQDQSLDLRNLQPGMYILKMASGKEVDTYKIIKQ